MAATSDRPNQHISRRRCGLARAIEASRNPTNTYDETASCHRRAHLRPFSVHGGDERWSSRQCEGEWHPAGVVQKSRFSSGWRNSCYQQSRSPRMSSILAGYYVEMVVSFLPRPAPKSSRQWHRKRTQCHRGEAGRAPRSTHSIWAMRSRAGELRQDFVSLGDGGPAIVWRLLHCGWRRRICQFQTASQMRHRVRRSCGAMSLVYLPQIVHQRGNRSSWRDRASSGSSFVAAARAPEYAHECAVPDVAASGCHASVAAGAGSAADSARLAARHSAAPKSHSMAWIKAYPSSVDP